MREAEKFLERLAIGTWTPNIDLCETKDGVTVRIELPGVDLADISVTIQHGMLRIQGIKREPAVSQKLLCYYCVERTYGKFQREIRLDWVVDARQAVGALDNGVLTIELPKVADRRGSSLGIPVKKK